MAKNWWKALGVILLTYTMVAGILLDVPRLNILNETIRNLYFHVGIWFAMIITMLYSSVNSIRFLNSGNILHDIKASESARVGLFLGVIGILTGMVWANFTWGTFWTGDPQLNGAAITLAIYFAYFLLRNAIEEAEKRGRISGIYNILAFVMMIVFIGIIPRMQDSLHPGKGGNPGFGNYDLDSGMKMVFYPAVLGYIIISMWITQIRVRISKINEQLEDR